MSSPSTPATQSYRAGEQSAKTHSHGKWLLNHENGKRVKVYESPVPAVAADVEALPGPPLDNASASCPVELIELADTEQDVKQERDMSKSETQEAAAVDITSKDPIQSISVESKPPVEKPVKRPRKNTSTKQTTTLRRSARVRGKTS